MDTNAMALPRLRIAGYWLHKRQRRHQSRMQGLQNGHGKNSKRTTALNGGNIYTESAEEKKIE